MGGASRAVIALAKYSAQSAKFRHSVLSLSSPDKQALMLASEAGVDVCVPYDTAAALNALAQADIVHFHYWNSPELYQLLLLPLPPMRSLLWSHVNGLHSPHTISAELLEMFGKFAAASPETLELNIVKSASQGKTELVFAGADFARLGEIQPQNHSTFNVGYIGTIDFAKMHPDFVAMSAGVEIPNARFVLCGDGDATAILKQQVLALSAGARFEFLHYVEDVSSVLSKLDVFGYPLCSDNYGASELVLQEAMYAGVPPVLLPFGGAPHLIAHGESGLVAGDEKEYVRAIEYLYTHPTERLRLGRNAAARARQLFGARNSAEKFNRIYSCLKETPKRIPRPFDLPARAEVTMKSDLGASLLIRSLGDKATNFSNSLAALEDDLTLSAETHIAAATPVLGNCVLQYWKRFPDDRHLALWSGLVLLNRNRPALATAALKRSIKLGCRHWRVHWYLARAARTAGSSSIADTALAAARMAAPQFPGEPPWMRIL